MAGKSRGRAVRDAAFPSGLTRGRSTPGAVAAAGAAATGSPVLAGPGFLEAELEIGQLRQGRLCQGRATIIAAVAIQGLRRRRAAGEEV